MPRRRHRYIPDPGMRPKSAVVLSLERQSNGRVRLFIDDARLESDGPRRTWRHDVFITASEWPGGVPRLSDDELAGLGHTVWASLLGHLR